MREIKSCAILGHNPMRFAWGFDEEAAECHDMKMELAQQIMVLRQQGVTHFSVACDYGVGLYAAEIINVLRNDDPELMLFCFTPHEEQATKWTPELRERYFDRLIKCTHMTAVSLHKQPDAQLEASTTRLKSWTKSRTHTRQKSSAARIRRRSSRLHAAEIRKCAYQADIVP